MKHYSESLPNLPEVSRHEAAVLALGHEASPPEFYVSLHQNGVVPVSIGSLAYGLETRVVQDGVEDMIHVDDPADQCVVSDPPPDRKEKLDIAKAKLWSLLDENICKYANEPATLQGIEIFIKRIQNAKTASSFGSLLCSMNNDIPLKFRNKSKIRITNKNRRTSSTNSRSFKGRPTKRAHALLQNVENNTPNG
jgi:hypothetical protein